MKLGKGLFRMEIGGREEETHHHGHESERRFQRRQDLVVQIGGGARRPLREPSQKDTGENPAEHQEGDEDRQRYQDLADIDAEQAVLPDVDDERPEGFELIHGTDIYGLRKHRPSGTGRPHHSKLCPEVQYGDRRPASIRPHDHFKPRAVFILPRRRCHAGGSCRRWP